MFQKKTEIKYLQNSSIIEFNIIMFTFLNSNLFKITEIKYQITFQIDQFLRFFKNIILKCVHTLNSFYYGFP